MYILVDKAGSTNKDGRMKIWLLLQMVNRIFINIWVVEWAQCTQINLNIINKTEFFKYMNKWTGK